MSLLKKLFGRAPKGAAAEASYPPRAPRIRVTPLHRLSFHTADADTLAIANVSTTGMALLRPVPVDWRKDALIEGKLSVEKADFIVQAHVRYLGEFIAGCSFAGENLQLTRAIERYLSVEILALRLRKVDEAYLKPDPRGRVVWLTDGKQNEIYCVSEGSKLVAFHLSFLGTYVEGSAAHGVRTGTVQNNDELKPGYKGAEMLAMSDKTPAESLRLAQIFVENVTDLPSEVRSQIEAMLAAS